MRISSRWIPLVCLQSIQKGSLTPPTVSGAFCELGRPENMERQDDVKGRDRSGTMQCSAGEFRKGLRYHPVDVAPERNHEVGYPVEPFPAPGIEFGRLAVAWR